MLSRFADHQKISTFSLNFPRFADHQKESRQFSQLVAFLRVKDRKNIPISICNLVVTQSMRRYQGLPVVHSFVKNQPERRGGQFFAHFFLFSHRNETSL